MMDIRRLSLSRHGRSVSPVLALDRRENRLYACRQAAVKIAGPETRRDFLVNDAFAERVGQDAFQSVADLQKHLVVLHKNKEHRPVVFALLPHLPRPGHAHGVIVNGRVRLHLWEDGHHDLVGTLALEIFERLVQLRRRAGGDDSGVVVEIGGRRRRNDFIREQAATESEKQDDAEASHGSRVGCRRGRLIEVKLDLGRCLGSRRGAEIGLVWEAQSRGEKYRRK